MKATTKKLVDVFPSTKIIFAAIHPVRREFNLHRGFLLFVCVNRRRKYQQNSVSVARWLCGCNG